LNFVRESRLTCRWSIVTEGSMDSADLKTEGYYELSREDTSDSRDDLL